METMEEAWCSELQMTKRNKTIIYFTLLKEFSIANIPRLFTELAAKLIRFLKIKLCPHAIGLFSNKMH